MRDNQQREHLEPAASIIARLGGEAKVSKITGTAYTAPYRWQYPKAIKGTGGLIPQRHHPALLGYARANDIPLSAADFIPGNVARETLQKAEKEVA